MSTPIVVIPGFMGSRLVRVRDGKPIWVDLLWALSHLPQFLRELSLTTPDDPELSANELMESVDLNNFVRQGIYSDLKTFALTPKPNGLGIAPYEYWEFPYDWRKTIVHAANDLEVFLLGLEPSRKVNLIAHSQGGLVVQKLFAMGGPGSKRVGKVFGVGCPFGGLVKTLDILEHGTGIPVLSSLPNDPLRFLLSRMPGAYELMPQSDQLGLFLDEHGASTTPFAHAGKLDTSIYQPELLQAAEQVVSSLVRQFPVPLRLIKGTGLQTAIQGRVSGKRVVIEHGNAGDGTVPNRSLEAGTGTAVGTEDGTSTLTIPGGEHVELIRDPKFFEFLKSELG